MSTLTHWGERSGLRYCNHAKIAAPCSPAEFLQMSDLCRKCERGARIRLGCAKPNPIRTDSDRYAELRKLVEAWQEAHRQHDQARTTAPETEGWLKHWLNFCDAQKPLLDWSHR